MSRIAPVPVELIDAAGLARVIDRSRTGNASVELASVLAYHRELFDAHVDRLGGRKPGTLLGARLSELVRLRSAQLGGCEQCKAARYDDSVGDSDVACMAVGQGGDFTAREAAALEFVRLMHVDHFAIDDAVYRGLHEHFSTAEILELGMTVAGLLGTHRFLYTLDLLGTDEPAIAFDPADVHDPTVPAAATLA